MSTNSVTWSQADDHKESLLPIGGERERQKDKGCEKVKDTVSETQERKSWRYRRLATRARRKEVREGQTSRHKKTG